VGQQHGGNGDVFYGRFAVHAKRQGAAVQSKCQSLAAKVSGGDEWVRRFYSECRSRLDPQRGQDEGEN
jgi:hypothetical protein